MVKNEVYLNYQDNEIIHPKNIFLTGCNMGGKSTTMRSLGINIILA